LPIFLAETAEVARYCGRCLQKVRRIVADVDWCLKVQPGTHPAKALDMGPLSGV